MKKQLSFALCLVLLLSLCLSFTACGGSSDVSISYGDAYVVDRACADDWQTSEDYTAYWFNADGTGKYERYYEYHSTLGASYDYVFSATIEFVWQAASNGSVYLFETKVTKNAEHTSDAAVALSTDPFYFSGDLLIRGNDDVVRFVREGSELFDILKAANAEGEK